MGGALTGVRKLGDFTGKKETTVVLYGPSEIGPRRIVLVGLGERKKVYLDGLRTASAIAASKAIDLRAAKLTIAIHRDLPMNRKTSTECLAQTLTEAAFFGAYRWDEYLPQDDSARPQGVRITILAEAKHLAAFQQGIRTGTLLGQAQTFARTMMNRPANQVNPEVLAGEARKLARRYPNLSCTIFNEKQLREKKFGGILAVGQGSANPPRLIVLKYTPRKAVGNTPTLALVGKAITFDSGGISIKPSEGMQDMKLDKTGGVAVLGAMMAIASLKPSANVIGLIPSAENMPAGGAYRPGDIVTTLSGKTVEIHNTDAEGRMLLCDAIEYARQLDCGAVVDIATLTGACVVALGEWTAGVMGNNDGLIEQLRTAAAKTGEKIWPLPCGEEYLELMKSKIADLKNTGGRWGGACSAAAFLGTFADTTPWAHLDIAGVGTVDGAKKFGSPGSIGFGVRLLTQFAREFRSVE
jgi:leucyl aminopeptidase